MLRTHHCGELRLENKGTEVILCGWVQRIRDKGKVIWIDLRDRYGLTQLIAEEQNVAIDLFSKVRSLGREFVLCAKGRVIERSSKNPKLPTGDIEVALTELDVLNPSKVPPFLIEENTDGGEELRMKYRYLDLRRPNLQAALRLRQQLAHYTRNYLFERDFLEVETPVLIKSTPEGARDFVVPSRMNKGEFYALPQSPQTFKQLLMVASCDKYFQIVKCFRDEDLRADRQPEFTQIDCEMSFVDEQDVRKTFEDMVRYLFKKIKGIGLGAFPVMSYQEAITSYGSDKPHIGFDMKIKNITKQLQHKDFKVFNEAEAVVAICAKGQATSSRKQIDEWTKWVQSPQIGAKGLAYVKCQDGGTYKSSLDKFYSQEDWQACASTLEAEAGDLMLILSGDAEKVQNQMGSLRLEMAKRLGLIKTDVFYPLWVVDFPLLEQDEETGHWHAMHHPFTSPKDEDINLLDSHIKKVRAKAYDMVINGVEVGGGSIRIHNQELQAKMFEKLGFSEEEAMAQFGFLMNAFEYGAPPHGGIAFGFDRLCALMGGSYSIRDYIAFPKNTSGRDIMIDSPAPIGEGQKKELGI